MSYCRIDGRPPRLREPRLDAKMGWPDAYTAETSSSFAAMPLNGQTSAAARLHLLASGCKKLKRMELGRGSSLPVPTRGSAV